MNDHLLFLTADDVIELHDEQIKLFGGGPGTLNFSLIESAVEHIKLKINDDYLHQDIIEMAASLHFSIAKNHPFVDGNKRTAAYAMDVFLRINGYLIQWSADQLAAHTIAVAEGSLGKKQHEALLRQAVIKKR